MLQKHLAAAKIIIIIEITRIQRSKGKNN